MRRAGWGRWQTKAVRGLTALRKHCVRKLVTRFIAVSRKLSECVRVFAPLFGKRPSILDISNQKSSGTFIPSVLNEYTDFTKPDRALVSNQGAEHHGY